MSQITFTLNTSGTPTDATSVVLADPTNAFGLRRTDTNAVLVAAGTAMSHFGTGVYNLALSDPAGGGYTYEYWIKWVYAGSTYTEQRFMAVPSTAITDSSPNLQIATTGGLTLYAQIVTFAGLVWNTMTQAFESPDPSNWSKYAIALVEPVPGLGNYFGTFPSAIATGKYLIPVYQQQSNAGPSGTSDFKQGITLVADWNLTNGAMNSIAPLEKTAGTQAVDLPKAQTSVQTYQNILNSLLAARLQLASQPFVEVSVDGQMVRFSSPEVLDKQIYWYEKRIALLSGQRRRMVTMRMGGNYGIGCGAPVW